MKLYNFKRLILKYGVTFCLHRTQGGYISGRWEEGGEAVTQMKGAIVPISDKKVYDSGGTYTARDRELYLSQPLRAPLDQYKVVYKGNAYKVEQGRNYEDYADAAVYMLKWISKAVEEHD